MKRELAEGEVRKDESPVASGTDLRVKALADEIRRDIITVLYTRGPLFYNQLAEAVHLTASHLAYHLKLLLTAGLVEKELVERRGKSFASYSVTDTAVQFLEFIGAKRRLDQIVEQRREGTSYPPENNGTVVISTMTHENGTTPLVKQVVQEIGKQGFNAVVADGPKLSSQARLHLALADMIRGSKMVVLIVDRKPTVKQLVDFLGHSLASDKPVVVLIERKYKKDFEKSDLAREYEERASHEMSIVEYNSLDPKGGVQGLVQIVRSGSKDTRSDSVRFEKLG